MLSDNFLKPQLKILLSNCIQIIQKTFFMEQAPDIRVTLVAESLHSLLL